MWYKINWQKYPSARREKNYMRACRISAEEVQIFFATQVLFSWLLLQLCRLKIKTKTCEYYNNIERQTDLDLSDGCGSGGCGSVAGDIEALRKNGEQFQTHRLNPNNKNLRSRFFLEKSENFEPTSFSLFKMAQIFGEASCADIWKNKGIFWPAKYFTSFLSILCLSNSEHWSQKTS